MFPVPAWSPLGGEAAAVRGRRRSDPGAGGDSIRGDGDGGSAAIPGGGGGDCWSWRRRLRLQNGGNPIVKAGREETRRWCFMCPSMRPEKKAGPSQLGPPDVSPACPQRVPNVSGHFFFFFKSQIMNTGGCANLAVSSRSTVSSRVRTGIRRCWPCPCFLVNRLTN